MKARAKYDQLIAEAPHRLDFHLGRVHVDTQRGSLFVSQRQWVEAEEAFKHAGDDLIALVKDPRAHDDCQLARAEVFHNLGILYDARGTIEDKKAALKHYGESLKIRQRLHQKDPTNRAFKRDLARSHGFMADTQLALGLEEEAKKSYDAAEDLRRSLLKGPNELEAKCQYARTLGNTGNYLDWTGKLRDAIKAHRDRKKYHQENLSRDQIPAEFQTDLADCDLTIASLQLDTSPLEEETALRVLGASTAGLGAFPLGTAVFSAGATLVAEETRSLLEKTLGFYQGLPGTNRKGKREKSLESAVAQIQVMLGKYHFLAGDRQKKAEQYLQQAEKSLRKLNSDAPLPDDLYNSALALALLGQLNPKESNELAVQHLLMNANDKGFMNVVRLKRDKGFRPFHQKPWFKKIVANIKKQRAKAGADARKQAG
jgi:tetratricopeptide (TPR) repeat protein